MVERAFLKVVFPRPVPTPANSMRLVRFGDPEVYVIDRDGNELFQVDYVQDVNLFAGRDQFMAATITASVKFEFPEGE